MKTVVRQLILESELWQRQASRPCLIQHGVQLNTVDGKKTLDDTLGNEKPTSSL